MSKQFGYDDVELDRPDLNKCPDCECYFSTYTCPLCKKVCPEEMRSGNRLPPPKPKKRRKSADSGRVRFINWYHEWWFIVILFLIMPLAGLVVLFTSPHKFRHKIMFVVGYLTIPLILSIVLSLCGSALLAWLTPDPVDTSLTREEYVEKCAEVDPEEYYRNPESFENAYVKISLTVVSKSYKDTDTSGTAYYLCHANGRTDFYIIIRDCFLDGEQNLLVGDEVTFYGQYGASQTVIDQNSQYYTAPCIKAAYADLNK